MRFLSYVSEDFRLMKRRLDLGIIHIDSTRRAILIKRLRKRVEADPKGWLWNFYNAVIDENDIEACTEFTSFRFAS